jgi:hypothetical protein
VNIKETLFSGMDCNIAPTLLNIRHYMLSVIDEQFNKTLYFVYIETSCMHLEVMYFSLDREMGW